MTNEDTIRCIYCLQTRPKPRRGEHVLLDALSGTTTIRDVCLECNGHLSKLDMRFLRSSIVTFGRILVPGQGSGQIVSPQFMPMPDGGYLDCTLTTKMGFDLPPQFYFRADGAACLVRDDDSANDTIVAIQALVGADLNAIRSAVVDRPEHVPARLIFPPKPRKGSPLIRARSETDRSALIAKLAAELPRFTGRGDTTPAAPGPGFSMRLSMDFNTESRCAAKMLLNLACYHLGADAVLGTAFDDVRAFILGEDVIAGPTTDAEGPGGMRVDLRFLEEPWWEHSPSASNPDHRCHVLALYPHGNRLCGEVRLFGGTVTIRPIISTTFEHSAIWPVMLFKHLDVAQDIIWIGEPAGDASDVEVGV